MKPDSSPFISSVARRVALQEIERRLGRRVRLAFLAGIGWGALLMWAVERI
ncbi:MAG TPA: hypothetical protein VK631_10990 [Solirubrobacteraceae bacterium]|nr:hypothetical protein [Solirubrobacteraceae bacterium]